MDGNEEGSCFLPLIEPCEEGQKLELLTYSDGRLEECSYSAFDALPYVDRGGRRCRARSSVLPWRAHTVVVGLGRC